MTHGENKVFGIESLHRIADPAGDQRIRGDLLMGEMREGGLELRRRYSGDRRGTSGDEARNPGSHGGLILRGFCLASGYEFLRIQLDVRCPKTRFHLRYPFIIRHDSEETGIGKLSVKDAIIWPVKRRPLTLVTSSKLTDGKRWIIGNDGAILKSSSIYNDENILSNAEADAPPAPSYGGAPLPLLHRYPSHFVPFATDDYFVVGYSDSLKRIMVLDYLDLDCDQADEEEDRRKRDRESAAGRGGWHDLLGRMKKLNMLAAGPN